MGAYELVSSDDGRLLCSDGRNSAVEPGKSARYAVVPVPCHAVAGTAVVR